MSLISRIRRARTEDDGFTLMEVVVTVIIIGVIVSALTGVVISYLKTTVDTQSRMTESQDVQFAATYWQRDVASVGVRTYNSGSKTFPLQQSVNVTPGCSLPTGTNVVTLAWTDYTSLDSTDNGQVITVTYVRTGAAAPFELVRVRCTGSTVDSKVEVAHSLTSVNASCDVTCTGTGNNVPIVISLSLSVLDPEGNGTVAYTATLSGERRQR